ncbi:hypothetical protein Dxin01_04337 [Deinococcus xinjiangensis]|uniref:Uncharacterized protein n=1 Tax=Deinococcus xinjiangensis TaxID=457454 RepID=A0ABP9VH63_9DEIO
MLFPESSSESFTFLGAKVSSFQQAAHEPLDSISPDTELPFITAFMHEVPVNRQGILKRSLEFYEVTRGPSSAAFHLLNHLADVADDV